MSRYEMEDHEPYVVIDRSSSGAGSFLLGLAIGAAAALLFAPRSGRATRRDIRRRALRVQRAAERVATDVSDGVADTFYEARRKVEDQIDSARNAIDIKRQQVHRAMDAGRAAAREAREELEQRIAEGKAAQAPVAGNGRANAGVADEV
jgi:gas vesicle protein